MNKVASILKKGSIALLILGTISALLVSIKTEMKVTESKYTWKENTYEKTTSFDLATMLTLTFATAISCTLTYAFGELIDIEDKKRKYLIARFGDVEIKTETSNTQLTFTINHEIDNVNKSLKACIEDKSLEKLGYQFDGSNDSTKSYYFKMTDIKVEVLLKSKDDNSATLVVSTANNITNDILRTKMDKFITCLSSNITSKKD